MEGAVSMKGGRRGLSPSSPLGFIAAGPLARRLLELDRDLCHLRRHIVRVKCEVYASVFRAAEVRLHAGVISAFP